MEPIHTIETSNVSAIPKWYTRQDNLDMWNTLNERQKKGMLLQASNKFPYILNHMKLNKCNVTDEGFIHSYIFPMLMELINRKENKFKNKFQ